LEEELPENFLVTVDTDEEGYTDISPDSSSQWECGLYLHQLYTPGRLFYFNFIYDSLYIVYDYLCILYDSLYIVYDSLYILYDSLCILYDYLCIVYDSLYIVYDSLCILYDYLCIIMIRLTVPFI